MSNVYLKSTKGRGRGVYAERDLDGAVYDTEFFAVPLREAILKICSYCYERTNRKCARCRCVVYCSTRCQRKDWKLHKNECKLLLKNGLVIPPQALLLLRMYQAGINWELESHVEDYKENGTYAEHVNLARGVHAILQDNNLLVSLEQIINQVCKITVNTMTFTDRFFEHIGIGIEKTFSLINHDCDPNCIPLFDGRRLCVRTLRRIKKDEELTTAYVDPTYPTAWRQTKLLEDYFFICDCKKCGLHGDEKLNERQRNVLSNPFKHTLTELYGMGLSMRDQPTVMRHWDTMKFINTLKPSIIFPHLLLVVEAERYWFPQRHPLRLTSSYALFKLMCHMQPEDVPMEPYMLLLLSLRTISEAALNVDVALGPKHSLSAEIKMAFEVYQKDSPDRGFMPSDESVLKVYLADYLNRFVTQKRYLFDNREDSESEI